MTLLWITVVVGALIGVVYVTLGARSFLDVRERVLSGAGGADELGDDRTYRDQGRSFSWKAGAGVVASTALLAALGLGPALWYVLPLLAVGSSVAVIVAFLTDRTTSA